MTNAAHSGLVSSLDLDKLLIHLPRAKTGARDVPISANLKQFLQQYLQSIGGDEMWLFASSASKSGHTESIAKPWHRIVEAAGLSDRHITRHTLRHTAITHLVQAGVDLPTVQRVSGHKTFEMVFRYSHQNQQHVQDALAKLDGRIVFSSPRQPAGVLDPRSYTGNTQTKRTRARKGPQVLDKIGGPCRDRTCDKRIKSPLLYQLS
jgi:integrase-like protein